MRYLNILAVAGLLAGCGPSQSDVDAASAEQRQDEARADSLGSVAAGAPTATGHTPAAPTGIDSFGMAELERNAHLKRMIDSTQSSLGL